MTDKNVLKMFPLVALPGRKPGTPPAFGGSQYWYARHTARYSGCGPVAAANLFAVLAREHGELAAKIGLRAEGDGGFSKAEYLRFMEDVYAEVGTRERRRLSAYEDKRHAEIARLLASGDEAAVRRGLAMKKSWLSYLPASFGNSAESFCRGVLRYADAKGIALTPHTLKTRRAAYEEGLGFIEAGLGAGTPVVLLSWLNRHAVRFYPQHFTDLPHESVSAEPHFLTIAALRESEKGPELLVSDRSLRAGVPYASLQKSWQGPGAYGSALLYFTLNEAQ